jgi:diacylglycerol kinase family enzyme
MMSVLVGKREGGFVLAPKAEIDDGWFDYVHAGELSRFEVLRFLPRLALYGPPDDYPKVRQGRCRHVRLTSEAPLLVHLDGEFFCLPDDNVRELEIDLLPGALQVESGLSL